MRNIVHVLAATALALPLLIAAGTGTAAPTTPPADKAAPAAPATPPAAGAAADGEKVVGPPEVAWKDMTGPQRGKFMKAVIVPKMKPLFQEFDAKEFAKFGCDTCHGKDAKAKKFKMPNPEIHALPGSHEAFDVMMKKKPSWAKWAPFMSEKVVPTMATLMGLPKFDPAKPDPGAFGCANCHTIDKKLGVK
jgi:hypothetical protein